MTYPERSCGGVSLKDGEAKFTLRSRHATAVELCLYESGRYTSGLDASALHLGDQEVFQELRRAELERVGEGWFEASVPGVEAGQLYGYRVHGPWQPQAGHRFDPRKLLVDPCARALIGGLQLLDDSFGLGHGSAETPADSPSGGDTAGRVPFSMVVDDRFDWQGVQAPSPRGTSLETLASGCIYELHVRGMTMLHPEVPLALRGTYLGLVHPSVIEHLQSLGVSAVELMPVAHRESELHLQARGLTNYWGYSPVALCAPDARFASVKGCQVSEFKTMVRELHRAGISVLLDVVLNHTVEGGSDGPTVSLRGVDNASYYRHEVGTGRLIDFTGCGHTLDFSNELVVDLALHSLRVWAREYRVDGFRFDLATVLGRGDCGLDSARFDSACFDPVHPFFERLREDPLLSTKCLIAEPWDLGPNGYALGRFPVSWGEWNDRYRRAMRGLWRGDGLAPRELQARLKGSPDLLMSATETSQRRSIDYVTSHDGFTLEDLVTFERKHNLLNGEDNRDGSNDNQSNNWGEEGPSGEGEVLERRRRAKRGLLTMLGLSGSVPMLLHGDELERTQQGNNNAYCQDNPTSWLDWQLDAQTEEQLQFVRALFAWRRRRPELMAAGRSIDIVYPPPIARVADTVAGGLAGEAKDEQTGPDASDRPTRCAVLRIRPPANLRSEEGDDSCELLVLLNTSDEPDFVDLPAPSVGGSWRCSLSSTGDDSAAATVEPPDTYRLEPLSVILLEPLNSAG